LEREQTISPFEGGNLVSREEIEIKIEKIFNE
jgi:hypothetical protein